MDFVGGTKWYRKPWENTELDLDRTRQGRGNARGLDLVIGVGNRHKFLEERYTRVFTAIF